MVSLASHHGHLESGRKRKMCGNMMPKILQQCQNQNSWRRYTVGFAVIILLSLAYNLADHLRVKPTRDASQCCVMCTTPKDVCCLSCADVSTPHEHDLLMATMEGLTYHIMDKHSSSDYPWLTTRAWEGFSHIGNRPKQAAYYYDWVRALTIGDEKVKHVCEIGMNGGHSVLVFLAALSQNDQQMDAKLTMFDLEHNNYTLSAQKYIEAMYPRRAIFHKGYSQDTVPEWTSENINDKCDVFSVDGDHSFKAARRDILNAVKATKRGGRIILDDMDPDGPTRQAFESALADSYITDPRCVENVYTRVGYDDRTNETNAREMILSWCTATAISSPLIA